MSSIDCKGGGGRNKPVTLLVRTFLNFCVWELFSLFQEVTQTLLITAFSSILLPCQRKSLLNQSILFLTSSDNGKINIMYVGRASKTELMRVNLPPREDIEISTLTILSHLPTTSFQISTKIIFTHQWHPQINWRKSSHLTTKVTC